MSFTARTSKVPVETRRFQTVHKREHPKDTYNLRRCIRSDECVVFRTCVNIDFFINTLNGRIACFVTHARASIASR